MLKHSKKVGLHVSKSGFKLRARRHQAGFTLIEISVVIGIVLGLAALSLWGVTAWRDSANKSTCVLNISNVQKAVRSFANINNLNAGDTLLSTSIIGAAKLLEAPPVCKSSGTYTYTGNVPAVGTAYSTCSVAGHAPASLTGW